MPRKARVSEPGYVYHVINRGTFREQIFSKNSDYELFEELIFKSQEKNPIRICAYVIMPNHWHLVLWPYEKCQLSKYMHYLTSSHVQKLKKYWGMNDAGGIYQGRYKSFLVETSEYYLNLVKYVEANPVRSGLAYQVEDWQWSSFAMRSWQNDEFSNLLLSSPVRLPRNWREIVNEAIPKEELGNIRKSVAKSSPYGESSWVARMTDSFGIEHTIRNPGRPSKQI